GQVGTALIHARRQTADDVGMDEVQGSADLPLEALSAQVLGPVAGGQQLDGGHLAIGPLGEEDLAHAALAETAEDLVSGDGTATAGARRQVPAQVALLVLVDVSEVPGEEPEPTIQSAIGQV